MSRWIANLDSEDFNEREKAMAGLGGLGKAAEHSLKRALEDKPGLEARYRIEKLLESIEQGSHGPEYARSLRAVEILERIGSPEARRSLEALSKGAADADLTLEAKAALERLKKRER